jgi:hypothetical protein
MSREVVAFHKLHEIGFFGHLSDCVLISKACEEKGVEPYFFIDTPITFQEGMSRNALSYYFTQPNLSEDEASLGFTSVLAGNCVEVRSRYDINQYWSGDPIKEISTTLTSVAAGRGLFQRNLAVRPEVARLADDFYTGRFGNRKILGIHYRGTDKKYDEANPVGYKEFIRVVEAEFTKGYAGIFLASDELSFAKFLISSSLGKYVFFRVYPHTDQPAFRDKTNNFQKFQDGIVDWMLLSRCDLLIKTPSLLSAWCQVLNPSLPIMLVGEPYVFMYDSDHRGVHGYWPEFCLQLRVDDRSKGPLPNPKRAPLRDNSLRRYPRITVIYRRIARKLLLILARLRERYS